MKKLETMQGIQMQTAFEMKLGAKPSLRGQTITGKLVMVGYGHDDIDSKFDYINLSDLSEKKQFGEGKLIQQGFYIKISDGRNDIEVRTGEMVHVKLIDHLASSDWNMLDRLNLIMNQLGRKVFQWFGQLSEEGGVKTILPYMAIYFEPNLEDGQFFINEYSEHLIEDYVEIK